MPTSTVPFPESPVVAQGSFNLAAISEVRRSAIGKAIVLTGPGVKRLVTADQPLELAALLTGLLVGGYTHYTVIDTTAKQTTRSESKRMTSDPRYTFNLTIAMSARIIDPIAYLDDFGPNASIFDAFYSELIEDLSNTLSDCQPHDMREAQRLITSYAATIRKSQPYHKGVQILQFNVTLEYGDEIAQRIHTLDQLDLYERYGDEYLAVEGALNPTVKARNDEMTKKLREIEVHRRESKHEEFDKGLEAIKKFQEVTGEDIRKIVEKAKVYDTLGNLIAPPRHPESASGALLIASGQSRNAPNSIAPPKGGLSKDDVPPLPNSGTAQPKSGPSSEG